MVQCPSICPSIGHSSEPSAAGLLLCARWAGDISLLLHGRRSEAAGKCGQCQVVSIRS